MNAQNRDGQTVAELKAEIDQRNDGRVGEEKIPVDGNKADLIAALDLDDEQANDAHRDVAEIGTADELTAPREDAPETEVEGDDEGRVTVTLTHAELGTEVTVTKPSADYTNYVRSYGYREEGSK